MKPLIGIVLGLWAVFQPCFAEDWRDEIGAQMKEAEKMLFDPFGAVKREVGINFGDLKFLQGQWEIYPTQKGKGLPGVIEFINGRKAFVDQLVCQWKVLKPEDIRYTANTKLKYHAIDTGVTIECEGWQPFHLYGKKNGIELTVDYGRAADRKFKEPKKTFSDHLVKLWDKARAQIPSDMNEFAKERYNQCLKENGIRGSFPKTSEIEKYCYKELVETCRLGGSWAPCREAEFIVYNKVLTEEEKAARANKYKPLKTWGH